jgi:penicillin amidase
LMPFLIGIALLFAPRVWATGVTDLPITQTVTFPQLSAPVDVVRDTHGIPHVYAATLNDAAFVIGYVHATDRMFQMDVFRRIPSGTISELLGFPDFQIGPDASPTDPPFPGNISNVTQDLFFQTLGLRRAAVDSFNAMSPSVQSALQSYADGVNEIISLMNTTGNLPAEYAALHITHITPWTPIDSIAFGKLQAFQLNANAILSALEALGTFTVAGDHHNIVDYAPALTTQNTCAGTYVRIPIKHAQPTKKSFKTRVVRGDGTKDIDTLTITCTP